MHDIPLHPALVHIPLGLAIAMPIVAGALAWARWRGHAGRLGWSLAVGLQALVLIGGLVAEKAAEDDEERVEQLIGHAPIHEHEEAAEDFIIAAGVATGIFVLALLLTGPAARWLSLVAAGSTLAVLGLGVQAGKLGGELVYEHGAANAFISGATPRGPPAGHTGRDHDDDGDEDRD